jgi:hypothetical protein
MEPQLLDADSDGALDLAFMGKNSVIVYPSGKSFVPFSLLLSEETAAYDIADADSDGRNELIFFADGRFSSRGIHPNGTLEPEKTLFSVDALFPRSPYGSLRRQMTTTFEGRKVLIVPRSDALEYRTLDGAVVKQFTTKIVTNVSVWKPKSSYMQKGANLPYRLSVDSEFTFERERPEFLPEDKLPDDSRSNSMQLGENNSEYYYWFPLKTDGTTLLRALCRRRSTRYPTTLVRIMEAGSQEDLIIQKNHSLGPERKYPGKLIETDDHPDFNHDGYVDLALWKTQTPGMSVDSLTRAIMGGVWPFEIYMHLYSPENKRYNPAPSTRIKFNIPIEWFIRRRYPVQDIVMKDFNGDGRTDFACKTTDSSYAVWFFTDKGFPEKPDFEYVSPERIKSTYYTGDLEGKGRLSIILALDRSFAILHAN